MDNEANLTRLLDLRTDVDLNRGTLKPRAISRPPASDGMDAIEPD